MTYWVRLSERQSSYLEKGVHNACQPGLLSTRKEVDPYSFSYPPSFLPLHCHLLPAAQPEAGESPSLLSLPRSLKMSTRHASHSHLLTSHAHYLAAELRPSSFPTHYCGSRLNYSPDTQPRLLPAHPPCLLLFLKCKFDHVSFLLKILHLLPITFRIKSNLFSMSHTVLCDPAPLSRSGLLYSKPTSLS